MRREDKEAKQMLLAVNSVNTLNPDIATLRPASVGVMDAVNVQLNKIIAATVAAGIIITGEAINKEKAFELFIGDVFLLSSAASGFASKPGFEQPILKAKVNATLAQLLNTPYNLIETVTTNIINAVTPVIASLSDYGALPPDLARTNLEFAAFLLIQNDPQSAIITRSTQNSDIHPFVKEGKRLLDEAMDPIIDTLITLRNDIYKSYYTAREIKHFPAGTTIAEGYVFKPDGITGIYHATVDFPLQGISILTMLDGSYRYPLFPHGIATPTATATGFLPNTASPYEVKQGKTVKHNFIMST
jgi:hypothetical protein